MQARIEPGPTSPPPTSREAVLAAVEPFRRRIYVEVRAVVDDVEAAAAWDDLLVPSTDSAAFAGSVAALLGVVRAGPTRLEGVLAGEEPAAGPLETREEARFYFRRIHDMVAPDAAGLTEEVCALVDPTAAAGTPPPAIERVAESALDLKAKYTSALMGAAASFVAEGRWHGVATAGVLFPEKRAEEDRNRRLLGTVREALGYVQALPERVDLIAFHDRWRSGRRVERHALHELARLEVTLGKLLESDLRPALFTGDFRRVQERAEPLGRTLRELGELHLATWEAGGVGAAAALPIYPRLVARLLELAARLDRQLLEMLLGRGAVRELETAPMQAPPALAHLVEPVGRDDLRTILEELRVQVQRRGSLQSKESDPAADEGLPEPAPGSVAEPVTARVGRDPLVAAPRGAGPVAPESRSAVTQSHDEWHRHAFRSDAEKAAVLGELGDLLAALSAPTNREWQNLQLLRRLLAKHRQVPPALMEGIRSFVYRVSNDLVPLVEAAADFDALPRDAATRLMALCVQLSRTDLAAEDMEHAIPQALDRFGRWLDALRATARSGLRELEPR